LGVKLVFKSLIYTMVLLVGVSLMIDIFNLAIMGFQVNRLIQLSVRKACEYYTMETYLREDINSIDLSDARGINGTVVAEGKFFGYSNIDQAYEGLYTNNNEFLGWAYNNTGTWKNLDLLVAGLGHNQQNYNEDELEVARSYVDDKMTPANLGITYLNKDVVGKSAKWNITKILSLGKVESIIDENPFNPYVLFHGFRVYVNSLSIDNIQYEVVDAIDNPDRYKQITGVDPNRIGIDMAEGGDRAKVNVATILYSIDIGYEGITPLKRIIAFGMSGADPAVNINDYDRQLGNTYRLSGGNDSDDITPGRLVYFITP
jgi:hypothetical protein